MFYSSSSCCCANRNTDDDEKVMMMMMMMRSTREEGCSSDDDDDVLPVREGNSSGSAFLRTGRNDEKFFFSKKDARIYSFITHSMRITSARKHAQSFLPL